jgi:hypothetical protein
MREKTMKSYFSQLSIKNNFTDEAVLKKKQVFGKTKVMKLLVKLC